MSPSQCYCTYLSPSFDYLDPVQIANEAGVLIMLQSKTRLIMIYSCHSNISISSLHA